MSATTDFEAAECPPSQTHTHEPDLQNSDQEDRTSIAHCDDDCTETDYWFGKIYFRCVLAQEIFNRTPPGCSIVTVDSLLQSQLDKFPHQGTLEACERQGLSSSESQRYARQGDYQTSLLVLIGGVIRNNSSEAKRKLLQLLRAKNEVGRSLPSVRKNPPDNRTIPEAESPVNRMVLTVREPDPGISKYTSVLKEKGDDEGFVPNYNFQKVSETPPVYKAVVSFKDFVFEGQGRTKQLAKHEASRDACNALGLQLS